MFLLLLVLPLVFRLPLIWTSSEQVLPFQEQKQKKLLCAPPPPAQKKAVVRK
jgi:hypothetical protein